MAQCDSGFKLRPAPDLPSFRQTPIGSSSQPLGGCSRQLAPVKKDSPCPTGMCQMRLDYRPLSGDREDLQIIVERLRRINGNYPQIAKALSELSNVLHHIEEQSAESANINPSGPSAQRLVQRSPGEAGRQQAPRDSSRLGQHETSPLQPTAYQERGSIVSWGGMDARSLSCAFNTPEKRISARDH